MLGVRQTLPTPHPVHFDALSSGKLMCVRSKRDWIRNGFVAVGAASLVLGIVGFRELLESEGADAGLLSALAGSIGLFLGQGLVAISSTDVPMALQFARLAAPAITVFATFELFRTRLESAYRRSRARRRSDHLVLIGLGASGRLVATQMAEQGQDCVIAIDEGGGSAADVALFNRPRWAILPRDATSDEALRAAGAHNASLVHIATGQDGVDVAVASTLRRLASLRTEPGCVEVKVQIDSSTLCRRLQQQELERPDLPYVAVEYVNMMSLGAAAVLEFMATELAGLSNSMIQTSSDRLHLIGGTVFIDELAALCARSHRARLLLGLPTVSAHEPEQFSTASESRHSTSTREPGYLYSAIHIVNQEDGRRTIDDAVELSARHPRDLVISLCPTGSRPVRDRARSDAGAIVLVDPEHLVKTPEVLRFGPVELIARLIHLDYVHSAEDSDRAGNGEPYQPWSELPLTYKRACRAQAYDFGSKLSAIGCELSDARNDSVVLTHAEIEELARAEHDRWIEERASEGWSFGEVRDNVLRIHPDFRPYDELSDEAKEKDRRAVTRMPALAALIGLTVVRKGGA